MSKEDTEDFFNSEKKEWSKIKDELLYCYLGPYFNKVFKTQRTMIYLDGFAGAGTFNGMKGVPFFDCSKEGIPENLGSPFIALKALKDSFHKSKYKRQNHTCHIDFYDITFCNNLIYFHCH